MHCTESEGTIIHQPASAVIVTMFTDNPNGTMLCRYCGREIGPHLPTYEFIQRFREVEMMMQMKMSYGERLFLYNIQHEQYLNHWQARKFENMKEKLLSSPSV